jgi:prophage regulatory protein
MNDRLLRLPEVIRTVGLSRATIYRYVSTGGFPPPIPFGPRISLWSERRIQDWIAERKGEARSELAGEPSPGSAAASANESS